MRIVCSWCGKHLKEVEPLVNKRVSGGICNGCYKKITEEIKKLLLKELQEKDSGSQEDIQE